MEQEKLNALVTKAKAGDAEAMNDLISASYQDIYFYALKVTKNEDIAADVTQDSCLEIVETIKNLRESAAFVTWCRRIVYHHCLKRIGNPKEVPLEENEEGETILDRLPDETPGAMPEQVVEDQEFRKLMQDMIAELPEGQRSALLLYYYERLSVKQIAQIQGENENTIKSRLHQGRNAVKKQVENYEAKTGTKLYSISILPLLYFLFRSGKAEADAAASALAPSIQATVAPAIAAASGTAGAGAAATGATIFSSLGVKIAAGVLAVALAGGAVVAGIQLVNKPDGDGGQVHIHSYDTWDCDEEAHWRKCQCGEASRQEAHTYEDGQCTVCSMPQAEEPDDNTHVLDYTTLAGSWLNITSGFRDEMVNEFQVNSDGTFSILGTTYYPVRSEYFDDDPSSDTIEILLGDKSGDPDQRVLTDVTLSKVNGCYVAKLRIFDPEIDDVAFSNDFYREIDYAGYEKVALTPENFSQYIGVTVWPTLCNYDAANGRLWVSQGMDLYALFGPSYPLLGYPSWCQAQGEVIYKYGEVEYNIETGAYRFPDDSALGSEPLTVEFFGSGNRVELVRANEDVSATDGTVTWTGKVIVKFVPETVTGYVFVPVK